MKLSHSKLNLILTCPMSYFLNYKQRISLKTQKTALEIGSAVHWGIEHNTEDLTDYVSETSKYYGNTPGYNKDQVLAEAMIHGYLKHKDSLMEQLLTDYDGETKLELLDVQHEVQLIEPLKSYNYDNPHDFVGIIDLLILTNKGFIVVDYKTSSRTPDWDKYTDQLYRYIYLVNQEFPTIPVYKIAIINIKKTGIRQKQNENEESYTLRLKREYDINDNELILYHEFKRDEIDENNLKIYIDNLSKMADFAQYIDENKIWFINFNNAVSVYGKSEYWDIFYNTPNCEYLYKIKDPMFDEEMNEWTDYRACTKFDLLSITENVLNHYTTFKEEVDKFEKPFDKDAVILELNKKYKTDDELLNRYWNQYQLDITIKEMEEKEYDETDA